MKKTVLAFKNRHLGGFERAVLIIWIFIFGSLTGFILETVYHLVVFHEIQDRSGLLFGPFSPVYGCGAVIMALITPFLEKKPFFLVFFVMAMSGGIVEYVASWLMEFAFGVVAWDYTGTFLSVDGRTNGIFMIFWGILGVLFAKVLLPLFNNSIWPRLRTIPHPATCIIASLMVLNIAFTLVSLDRWEDRQKGLDPETPIQEICDLCFDDAYMSAHFETMGFIGTS